MSNKTRYISFACRIDRTFSHLCNRNWLEICKTSRRLKCFPFFSSFLSGNLHDFLSTQTFNEHWFLEVYGLHFVRTRLDFEADCADKAHKLERAILKLVKLLILLFMTDKLNFFRYLLLCWKVICVQSKFCGRNIKRSYQYAVKENASLTKQTVLTKRKTNI